MDSVAAAVTKINDMNLQIATASEQQSAVTEEMNNNLNSIYDESENTLVATRDTSEASQHVKEMATSLQQAVGYFKI
ncbi:MAG: hypothetical protein GY806_15230 [Gammaproteobacteria bacterium]|nr:hypothetical protein [Gammaproteobacteria bacterium]